jgi:glyoxylase-like metal-dependent hydrolase (beta-lactamase superfamily II)
MFAGVIECDGEIVVFDPGYAPRIREATEAFPDRLYRWTAPPHTPPERALAARLRAEGRLDAVTTIVLSHFHADHMAGLIDFPKARIVCSRAAFDHFAARGGLAAVASGYLKRLAPADLAERIVFAEDLQRTPVGSAFHPFTEGFDLRGDRSILLVPLPGHGAGQVGATLSCADGAARFLIADAAWSADALEADAPPPWATMRFLGRPRAYLETWAALRALAARNPDARLIPAHCATAAAREAVL